MGVSSTGSEHSRKVSFVLFVAAFLLAAVSTVIDFALEDGGFSAYLSLACALFIAVGAVSSFVRWRHHDS